MDRRDRHRAMANGVRRREDDRPFGPPPGEGGPPPEAAERPLEEPI